LKVENDSAAKKLFKTCVKRVSLLVENRLACIFTRVQHTSLLN
jgi:hypothetical protein